MFLSDGGLFSLIPTLFFILIIILSTIFGILRGFRKSVILGIQALVAFVACLIAYFVIVNNAQTDTNIVNIANTFLGDGGLQSTIGVSTSNSSLTDIIIEAILNSTNMGNGMALVLEENGAYLMAITNLVYHIVFFVLLWIVYLLLVFVFYIVYLIFYPERRHARKVNKKYQQTDPDKKYKHHRIFGGAVGAVRGIVAGLMFISIIGAIFYVVGGTGEGEYEEYDWGDDTYNTTYSIYSQTGSYGNSGIFKVLNTIKDQDNVPFYLFMANNFLSGNSYEGELEKNLVLSKDLGAVTVFARSSADLILKYGKEDIINAVKESGQSEEGSNKLLEAIGNVYSNVEFQNEFNKLIDDFNTNSFFINMTFSVLDSFVNHMNEMTLTEAMPADTVELLNVLFNKSYVSPYIPDDQANFDLNGEVATIKPNMLLQKDDVKLAFKLTFNILSNESTNDQVLDTVNLATTVMDDIDELSLLKSENKDTFNPVFERLYTYLSNYYLAKDPTVEEDNSALLSTSYLLEDTNSESIDWVNEINCLLGSVNSGLKLFASVYDPAASSDDVTKQVVNAIYSIFDKKNENYNYNHGLFKDVVNGLASSMLLGKVLETNFITKSMVGFLEQMTQGIELYIPKNIKYTNTATENGEIYNLFKGVEALFSNTETKEVMTDLINGATLTNNDFSKLCNSFLEDDEKALNYLLASKLVSSTVSGLLLSINIEDIEIIYPNSCKETVDTKVVNLIKEEEIKELIRMVPGLLDSLSSTDQTKGIIDFVINNKDDVSESDILCATVANYLVNSLPTELSKVIIVPKELKDAATKEELTSFLPTNPWRSEIRRLLDVFEVLELNDPNLDFSNSQKITDQIIGNVLELNDSLSPELLAKYQNENYKTKLDLCYGSPIILATLTEQIDANVNEEFIDQPTKSSIKDTNNYYQKAELEALIDSLNELEIKDFTNLKVDDVVNKALNLNNESITKPNQEPKVSKLDVCYNSKVIKSIISKQLDEKINGLIIEGDEEKVKHSEGNDKGYYTKEELSALVLSLNVLTIDLNSFNVDKVKEIILSLNEFISPEEEETKLDVVYRSLLFKSAITKQIDTNFDEVLLKSDEKTIVKEYYGMDYYPQKEIAAIIDSLKELGIESIVGIDGSTVKEKIKGLNGTADTDNSKTKLAVLYESMIVRFIIDNQITPVLNDIGVHERVINNSKNEECVNEKKYDYYNQGDLEKLINGINALRLDSIDNMSGIGFGSGSAVLENLSDNVKLATFYSSDILVDILTNELDNIIDTNEILVYNSEAKEFNSTIELSFYKQLEVKTLIEFINTELGGAEFSAIDSSSITIDSNFKTYTANSKILAATMTKQIVDNGTIVVPNYTILYTILDGEYNEGDYIIQAQMDSLIDGLITLFGTGSIDSIDLNISLSSSKIDAIYNSDILNATISKQLVSNTSIIIPYRVLKEDTTINEITNAEVKAFLTSVTFGLGISGKINDISPNDVKLPSGDLDQFVNSDIMRATVTKNVKATGPDELYVQDITDYCEKVKDKNQKDILVLSKEEVKALINSIKAINSSNDTYEINLSIGVLTALNSTSLDILLNSNIIRIHVTRILEVVVTTPVNAYELAASLDTTSVEIAEKSTILTVISII